MLLDSETERRFLPRVLGHVASWAFHEKVALEATAVGESDDDPMKRWSEFLGMVRARHALACAGRLRRVLEQVERQTSEQRALVARIATGRLDGRLDVPRYLAMRTDVTLPRRFPVIANVASPETPENRAVVVALDDLLRQLASLPMPRPSAEAREAVDAYLALRKHRRRWPWDAIVARGNLEALRATLDHRLRRRQTGNTAGYAAFRDWLDEWLIRPDRMGGAALGALEKALLALPAASFVWDRVFEIWCLDEVQRALVAHGCTVERGPLSLALRRTGPIWVLRRHGVQVEVWFQRSRPLGASRWRYVDGAAFRGIPDVVVASRGRPPLVVDAKLRNITSRTASDEIYKMLGYCENFGLERRGGFRGLLVFPEARPSDRRLTGPGRGWIHLAPVAPAHASAEEASEGVRRAVREWLDDP